MTGVSLSRWSVAYFAAALLALVLAEAMMAAGFGYPAVPVEAAETLVLVHVIAIGWLSLLLCGALFQFVPVLVAHPLHNGQLPIASLVLLVAGLASLVTGFLQLAGVVPEGLPVLPAGGVLLGLGFALVLYNLGRTLWAGRPLALPARFVVAGLVSLVATALLGLVFTLVLGGVAGAPHLVVVTASGLPIHAIAGLGGWLTFTAMGVSYRLLAMFMLAPEEKRTSSLVALWGGVGVLALAIVGGCAAILTGHDPLPVLAVAAIAALPVLGLYGYDVVALYRQRKRRRIETNSRMAVLAFLSLALAALLGLVLLATGRLPEHVGALVYLVGFGWLTGLGLAKLYKIVAFVTWLECYGPVLGRKPTPRVQDLVVEARADKWFFLFFAAVWLGTGALLLDWPLAFRGCALGMLVATGGLIVQYWRTRRLADVAVATRLPEGTRQPRLLVVLPSQG